MTGYGRSDEHNDNLTLSVEIRSLNSRFLDFSTRLPSQLAPFEDEAYKLVKQRCIRGRVTLSAKVEFVPGSTNGLIVNHDKLKEYLTIVKEIQDTSGQDDFPSIGDFLRLPEILSNGTTKNEDENEIKNIFINAINNALNEMEKIRTSEGENIQIDINKRLQKLQETSDKIKLMLEGNRDLLLKRYNQKLKDFIQDVKMDERRLYQEVVILCEKRDITEELVRLNSHYDLFHTYMNLEEYNGKKLNFLLQEIGREINTMTSKTDNVKISHLAVDMKDELEKIREQVQNIV